MCRARTAGSAAPRSSWSVPQRAGRGRAAPAGSSAARLPPGRRSLARGPRRGGDGVAPDARLVGPAGDRTALPSRPRRPPDAGGPGLVTVHAGLARHRPGRSGQWSGVVRARRRRCAAPARRPSRGPGPRARAGAAHAAEHDLAGAGTITVGADAPDYLFPGWNRRRRRCCACSSAPATSAARRTSTWSSTWTISPPRSRVRRRADTTRPRSTPGGDPLADVARRDDALPRTWPAHDRPRRRGDRGVLLLGRCPHRLGGPVRGAPVGDRAGPRPQRAPRRAPPAPRRAARGRDRLGGPDRPVRADRRGADPPGVLVYRKQRTVSGRPAPAPRGETTR